MKASVHVVTTKCVFRYIQAPTSDTQPVPTAHAWIDGSANTCSERSRSTMSRAWRKAVADWSKPRARGGGGEPGPRLYKARAVHDPVEPVRPAEQDDLPQHVARATGEQAREHLRLSYSAAVGAPPGLQAEARLDHHDARPPGRHARPPAGRAAHARVRRAPVRRVAVAHDRRPARVDHE